MGVYAKDTCSIPAGIGKYIPVQTSHEIMREVLIKTSDKTIPGLVLVDIVYNIEKKLECIFVENHNPESILLKQGQTIGISDIMRSDAKGARSSTGNTL